MPTEEITPVDRLERSLIGGRARWMADLNEFFRDYRIGETVFDLLAKGRTRNRGLFLSRFFSWTALPDYSVSLFCLNLARGGRLTPDNLRRMIEVVLRAMETEELHWAWLIVLSDEELPGSSVAFVSRYDRRELGVAIASTSTKQVVCSNNQVGRSVGKQLGLRKILDRVNET